MVWKAVLLSLKNMATIWHDIYRFTIQWLTVCFLAFFITDTFGASLPYKVYPILENNDGAGLWLNARIVSTADAMAHSNLSIKNAIKINNVLISLKSVKNLNQNLLITDIKTLNLRQTPALLPIDAEEVKYQRAWLWGNQVMLDVKYLLSSQRWVPWRSDYKCIVADNCKLLTDVKDQFFELSYFLIKQNNYANQLDDITFLQKLNSNYILYTMSWSDPMSTPTYGKKIDIDMEKNSSLDWILRIHKLDEVLIRNEENFLWKSGKSLYSNVFVDALNELKISADLSEKQYDMPLDTKNYGFFHRYYDVNEGMQSSKRIVYQEQLFEMVSEWSQIHLLGYLNLSDRSFLFLRPTLEDIDFNPKKSAVTVFEYRKVGNTPKFVFGVKADWVGAVLGNDYLLEAIRKGSILSVDNN